jgi:hypothetical protein
MAYVLCFSLNLSRLCIYAKHICIMVFLPWFSKLSHTTSLALFPITIVATIGLSALGSFVMVAIYSSLPSLPSSSLTSHVSPSSFSSSALSSFSILLFQFIMTFLFIIYIDLSRTCLIFPTFINVVLLPTEFPWGQLLVPRQRFGMCTSTFSLFYNLQGFILTTVPIKVVLSAFWGSTKHILTTINPNASQWTFSHRDRDSSLPWLWFLWSSSILLPFSFFSFFLFLR